MSNYHFCTLSYSSKRNNQHIAVLLALIATRSGLYFCLGPYYYYYYQHYYYYYYDGTVRPISCLANAHISFI